MEVPRRRITSGANTSYRRCWGRSSGRWVRPIRCFPNQKGVTGVSVKWFRFAAALRASGLARQSCLVSRIAIRGRRRGRRFLAGEAAEPRDAGCVPLSARLRISIAPARHVGTIGALRFAWTRPGGKPVGRRRTSQGSIFPLARSPRERMAERSWGRSGLGADGRTGGIELRQSCRRDGRRATAWREARRNRPRTC